MLPGQSQYSRHHNNSSHRIHFQWDHRCNLQAQKCNKKYQSHNILCFIKAWGYLGWNLLNWQVIMFKWLSFVRITPNLLLIYISLNKKGVHCILTHSSKRKRKVAFDRREGICFILQKILFISYETFTDEIRVNNAI